MRDASSKEPALLRYLRAFDFQPESEVKQRALEELVVHFSSAGQSGSLLETVQKLSNFDFASASGPVKDALARHLAAVAGSPAYFEMVERFSIRDQRGTLVKLAAANPAQPAAAQAVKLLISWGETGAIKELVASSPAGKAGDVLGVIGATGQRAAVEFLRETVAATDQALERRRAAVEALGRSRSGERELLRLARAKQIPEELGAAVGTVLGNSTDEGIRREAADLPVMAAVPAGPNLPPVAELMKRTGHAEGGRAVFQTFCVTCHQVAGQGINFGPALDEIGTKLPREQLFVSILDPNQGISFGYEGWEVQTRDGAILVGLVTSETDSELNVRAIGGVDNKIKKPEVTRRRKLPVSLMTPLAPAMNEQQLVDLVEFLSGLKKK
jgi:putative heme-binding domain-containing protein